MKKKRTKSYRPRQVSLNPLTEVFGGMSGAHAEHLRTLKLRNSVAFVDIVQGRGTRDSWDLLVGAINMGNVMCEMGIGNEFRALMIAGRDAMCEVGKRYVRTGRFVFTGDELTAMNEAMDCHTAQLENIRAIDVERAANEVLRRIREGINTTNVKREIAREAPASAPA